MRFLLLVSILIAAGFAYHFNNEPQIPVSEPVVKQIALQQEAPPNVYTLPVPAPYEDQVSEPLSEEDIVYKDSLKANATVLDEAVSSLLQLMNDFDPQSKEWQDKLTYLIGQVSAATQQAKELRPPVRFIGVQRDYVVLCNNFDTANYDLMQGLTMKQADDITKAVQHMQEASKALKQTMVYIN